jgi:aryl-alcohol dehydrogenase-like predicted oxidoreductase
MKTLQSTTGLSVGTIVLSYLLSQPFPVFPIIGPKKSSDLLESIEAAKATLSAENLAFFQNTAVNFTRCSPSPVNRVGPTAI